MSYYRGLIKYFFVVAVVVAVEIQRYKIYGVKRTYELNLKVSI